MSRMFVISAFGLNDLVLDCQRENCLKTGFILSSVIVKNNNFFISGLRAISNRACSGFKQYQDQKIESDFAFLEKIPVSILWHGLVNHKDTSKIFREVKHYVAYDPTEKNILSKRYPVCKLISQHIEELFCDYARVFKEDLNFKKSDIKFVVPIPNELSEYAQEELLRSFRKSREDIIFIWREIAALMQYLKLHHEECSRYIEKKIKVFYAGIDGFEYALFKLKKVGEYIVPIRERPHKHTTKLSGFNFICNCIERYIKINIPTENIFSKRKLIWQFLMTRSDAVESILYGQSKDCILPVSEPKIHLEKNINILNQDILSSLISAEESDLYSALKFALNDDFNLKEEDSILDLLRADNEECEAVLLCGELASKFMSKNFHRLLENKAPIDILYDESNLILEGCKLYAQRLSLGLPTYFDTLPLLEIAYYDKLEQDWEWLPLVSESLIEGGKTYHLQKPCTKFSLQKGANKLPLYLRTESLKSDDDGIHFSEKKFTQKAPQDIPLSIFVEMKAAYGLAKIIIKDKDHFCPINGYVFDYSEMKKAKLPDFSGSLSYPPEEKRSIYNDKTDQSDIEKLNSSLNDILKNINHFRNFSYRWSKKYIDQIKMIYDDIKSNLCFKMFDLNLNCINYEYSLHLDTILQATRELSAKIPEDPYYIPVYKSLMGNITYLYKGTPDSVKNFYRYLLTADHNISVRDYFYPACRCLYDNESDIRLIYSKYNSLFSRNKIYLHQAIYFLLNNVKEAKYCLDELTALNMLEACIASLNESKINKNYKNKFTWAIKLFLMSLKYRCIDKDFLASNRYENYIKRLNFCIDNAVYFYKSYSANTKYYEIILKIREQIQAYLYKKGSIDILNSLKIIDDEN